MSALAFVLAGALVGAGVVAGRTDALPFVSSPCWGSVDDRDLDEMLGGWDIDHAEVRPSRSDRAALSGQCRITSHDGDTDGRQVDLRVHQLSSTRDDTIGWSEEFLDSRLTPLGAGLVGMASDTRAWVALPSTCVRPGGSTGLGVVDVSMGEGEPSVGDANDDRAARHRMALARTAVHAANGAVAELGCPDVEKLPEPRASEPLPDFEPLPVGRDLCGVAGLRLPNPYVRSGNLMRTSAGGNPRHVRTCDVAISPYAGQPELRLLTVEDPGLVPAFADAYLNGGPSIETTGAVEVDGTYSPTVAAVRVDCGKGAVTFLAQERVHERDYSFIRKTFPAYVSAEADRLRCGTVSIQLPG